jgi:Ca2+-binding EF-hand superfamily protein
MKAIYAFASAAIVLATGLSAEEIPGAAMFQELDQDKDGYVTIIEATGQNELLRQWTEVDNNTDGRLEMTEFSAFEVEPETYVPVVTPDEAHIGAAPAD